MMERKLGTDKGDKIKETPWRAKTDEQYFAAFRRCLDAKDMSSDEKMEMMGKLLDKRQQDRESEEQAQLAEAIKSIELEEKMNNARLFSENTTSLNTRVPSPRHDQEDKRRLNALAKAAKYNDLVDCTREVIIGDPLSAINQLNQKERIGFDYKAFMHTQVPGTTSNMPIFDVSLKFMGKKYVATTKTVQEGRQKICAFLVRKLAK